MKVSVVIPAYQSEKTIGQVVDRIYQTFAYRSEFVEVIGVDDGSKDDTFRVLIEKTGQYPSMKAIRLQDNVGQQHALLCGIRQSTGAVVITLDDDLQHPPEEIPKLLQAMQEGYQLVYAKSKVKICGIERSLGSKLRDRLFNHLFELPEGLSLHSFRAVDGTLVREAAKSAQGFFYLSAALLKLGPSMKNIELDLMPRPIGKSNYTYRKLLSLFARIWIYYSDHRLAKILRHSGTPYRILTTVRSKGDHR